MCFSLVLYKSSVEKLDRLFASIAGLRLHYGLYIYDNSPTDRLGPMCRRAGAAYLHDPRNIGFGAANNQIIRATADKYDYHLILNPDIYFDPSVIARMIRQLDRRPEVVQLMPRIIHPDGQDQQLLRPMPRPLRLLARRLGLTARTVLPKSLCASDQPLFFSGCFMVIRSAALQQTTLFDERFFLYFEDVDLCWQLRAHGEQLYWPMVSVTHDWSGGSVRRWQLLPHHIRSFFKYFSKHGWRPLW